MARMKIVEDLEFPYKAKYITHTEERMQVWRKGYALYCDVKGVLYVYAKKGGLIKSIDRVNARTRRVTA
jgi:hypothetical protein